MVDYAGVLADLRARRVALDRERADLDTAIAAIERLAGPATKELPTLVSDLGNVALGGNGHHKAVTMPQAILGYLQESGLHVQRTTREVIDAMKNGNVKSSKNIRGHVYNTLDRLSKNNGPISRHPDGRWSLRTLRAGQPLLA